MSGICVHSTVYLLLASHSWRHMLGAFSLMMITSAVRESSGCTMVQLCLSMDIWLPLELQWLRAPKGCWCASLFFPLPFSLYLIWLSTGLIFAATPFLSLSSWWKYYDVMSQVADETTEFKKYLNIAYMGWLGSVMVLVSCQVIPRKLALKLRVNVGTEGS